MIKLNGMEITPTLFPDKTSQVWQLPDEILKALEIQIDWMFSSEAEIFHLCQLRHLLFRLDEDKKTNLYIDYLPCGRQDKEISNTTTFALDTLSIILNEFGFDDVVIKDPHSDKAFDLIHNSRGIYPEKEIKYLIKKLQIDTICYPDKGADVKYSQVYDFPDCDIIVGDKIRDQSTGLITDYKILNSGVDIENKNILIVDDICDGGATFIILTEYLLKHNVKSVNLFVTHGIFSKGLKLLLKAGISRIFTSKGEAIKMKDNLVGYKKYYE